MISFYFQGVMLGMALILPLGPQNAFVLNQGVRRQFHILTAALCSLSDILLICAGIFGGSALLNHSSLLLNLVTWGGVAFLFWYGWGALRIALSGNVALAREEGLKQSRWRIVAAMMAVTWLNPHVYLDTFVVLGSLGGQLPQAARGWFALGTISASIIWFFGLAMLSARLSPVLRSVQAQRIINLLVGIIMWFIAFRLVLQGINGFH